MLKSHHQWGNCLCNCFKVKELKVHFRLARMRVYVYMRVWESVFVCLCACLRVIRGHFYFQVCQTMRPLLNIHGENGTDPIERRRGGGGRLSTNPHPPTLLPMDRLLPLIGHFITIGLNLVNHRSALVLWCNWWEPCNWDFNSRQAERARKERGVEFGGGAGGGWVVDEYQFSLERILLPAALTWPSALHSFLGDIDFTR